MNILVERKYKKDKYTIGSVSIDGVFFCNSLEDKDRGLDSQMPLSQLKKLKVWGQTAIPTGTYEVKSFFWAKYRNIYPILIGVPAYTGVLIHGGVNHTDTSGCILLGENRKVGQLTNCAKYVRKITSLIQECEKKGEKVTITIR